eukprot:GILK01008618.1.p1 GENE.GILK01008618.1~~GILK01008618.1.p1  ORF type:complete len:307 (-),score=56.54 GILK01008618.1:97-951(-)
MSAVHKTLMKKLYTIEEEVGHKRDLSADPRADDPFLILKAQVTKAMEEVLLAIRDRKETFMKRGSSKDLAVKTIKIMDQIKRIENQLQELSSIVTKQAQRPKDFGGMNEITRRASMVSMLEQHLASIKDTEKLGRDTTIRDFRNVETVTDQKTLLLGANGEPASAHVRRELTADEKLALERFRDNDVIIEQELDEISRGVRHLGEIAKAINETVDKQHYMIDELDHKTERTTDHLVNINKRMKKTLEEIRAADKFIVDIVLIVIFLALVGYLYSLARTWLGSSS